MKSPCLPVKIRPPLALLVPELLLDPQEHGVAGGDVIHLICLAFLGGIILYSELQSLTALLVLTLNVNAELWLGEFNTKARPPFGGG